MKQWRKVNCEMLQHINSPTFLPNQDNNHLECSAKRRSKQQNSEHIQEPPRQTLGTESPECANHAPSLSNVTHKQMYYNIKKNDRKKIKIIKK